MTYIIAWKTLTLGDYIFIFHAQHDLNTSDNESKKNVFNLNTFCYTT